MKISLTHANPAFISIIKNPGQVITLDANFFIPPDRSQISIKGIPYKLYKEIWLDPVFSAFNNLAIHEAVYDELVGNLSRSFVDARRDSEPPGITILKDSDLTEFEKMLRNTIESKIASRTNYEPLRNNKDDRGEVKSLSYIAVKGLLYFATHDNNSIQLIEKSNQWSTGLDNIQAIKMYEIIYYLYKNQLTDKVKTRMLYKYLYYLTDREKETNPGWGDFITKMNDLYDQPNKTS